MVICKSGPAMFKKSNHSQAANHCPFSLTTICTLTDCFQKYAVRALLVNIILNSTASSLDHNTKHFPEAMVLHDSQLIFMVRNLESELDNPPKKKQQQKKTRKDTILPQRFTYPWGLLQGEGTQPLSVNLDPYGACRKPKTGSKSFSPNIPFSQKLP